MKKLFNNLLNLNKSVKSIILGSLEIIFIFISTYLSLSIIKSEIIPLSKSFIAYSILVTIFYLPISYFLNNYNLINRFFDLKNVINLLKSSFLTTILLLFLSFFTEFRFLFIENIIVQNFILFFFIINFRIVLKIFLNLFNKKNNEKTGSPKKKCIIYGAGETGSFTVENSSKISNYDVYCFVDDDLKKKGRFLKNIKIYHSTELKEILQNNNISKIFISILNLSTFQKQKIYDSLKNLSVEYEYLNEQSKGNESINKIDFQKEDILKIHSNNLKEKIKGKIVIVTGAAGTIGEELCFQLIEHSKLLIAVDKNELGISNLISKFTLAGKNNFKVYLSNLLNYENFGQIVDNHKPDFIFHAAAYKHVEICEENPFEAAENNCISIYNVLLASKKFCVPNFTFISTDKAVNPINIMGKTKQFGEFLVKYFSKENFVTNQNYTNVRFGNVLNSSGSLMPKIRKQIENGSDVLITHKEATRYFMTISDAVSLVLESSFLKNNGKTFVLKMGKAINIYNLALELINEYKVFQNKKTDIKIKIIGLRPGEKLHEELCHEGFREETENKNIFVDSKEFNLEIDLDEKINALKHICTKKDLLQLNDFFKF